MYKIQIPMGILLKEVATKISDFGTQEPEVFCRNYFCDLLKLPFTEVGGNMEECYKYMKIREAIAQVRDNPKRDGLILEEDVFQWLKSVCFKYASWPMRLPEAILAVKFALENAGIVQLDELQLIQDETEQDKTHG